MEYRFKPGEEVFIASRYKGVQRVKIQSQVDWDGAPCYELDKLVQITKDGDLVGNKEFQVVEEELWIPSYEMSPCPESLLFVVGDRLRISLSNILGATNDVFTQEMADEIK